MFDGIEDQTDRSDAAQASAPIPPKEKTVIPRDARGLFLKGKPGGPGRPKRETEGAYLRGLVEACPVDVWKRICERAVRDALDGDARARAWLGVYLAGAPRNLAQTPSAAAGEVYLQERLPYDADPVRLAAARLDIRNYTATRALATENHDMRVRQIHECRELAKANEMAGDAQAAAIAAFRGTESPDS